jgi:DNA-binding CsgD family transcriptional regulator
LVVPATETDPGLILARLRHVVGVFVLDDDRRCLLANPAGVAILGVRDQREVLGTMLDDLAPPAARERIPALWSELMRRRAVTGSYRAVDRYGVETGWRYAALAGVVDGRHVVVVPPASAQAAGGVQLTAREREILNHVAGGATAEEIAERLAISRTTVESHVRRAMGRLGARNRAHAIALGIQAGLVAVPPSRDTPARLRPVASALQPAARGGHEDDLRAVDDA